MDLSRVFRPSVAFGTVLVKMTSGGVCGWGEPALWRLPRHCGDWAQGSRW